MNSVYYRKEMYYRNNLKNKYFKCRSDVNWNNYKRQRNKVVNIRRTSIRTYFEIQCSHDSNGKTFWKTVKPFISDKGYSPPGNIMLQDNEELFSKKYDVVEIFNKYYSTIADDIGENDNIENKH